ncbi:DUF1254 domain-containing protein [Nocardia uniformis]|uniref:DUF1254 domain-containing protein n=1 Tax=Nocardia uniformis TaxID=53432 RepID=A0A849CGI3_9NOCA|nr:DUF1254 domain-containing protein [Nocardia uniformis]NNH76005.1 DUF1254 domain-containing protein [Nocardia uniformis]
MTSSAIPNSETHDSAFAYVYGFPLVFNLEQVLRFVTTGVGANPAAPFNTFGHTRALATPEDTFVSVNNDTVYSVAQLDLSVGPVRLSVPDTGGRYYVLQFVDAWTNNFAYIGSRATGTGTGEFLLVPPGWEGDDQGLRVIGCPTRIATIVGRWAVTGDDLSAVHALQDATTLTPLAASAPTGLPAIPTGLPKAIDFFEKFRVWSQALPPALRDVPIQHSFADLGLTGITSLSEASPELTAKLEAAYARGSEQVEEYARAMPGVDRVNGWMVSIHGFDYNNDAFEIGTIDAPEWKIADTEARIVSRAASARAGLWGNHGYEATYALTYTDSTGSPLDGNHRYQLTLDPIPPVNAFWSLTMYSMPDFYLVDNPIGRYSIGDRTPGLITNPDGSLTLTIGHDEPTDPIERANWLPAPPAPFRPALRMYVPRQPILDGAYEIAPIVGIS